MNVLNYRILLGKEAEGGYTVIVPSLPGCVTYGDTIEEAIEMAKEAIQLYLESLKEHDEEIPTEERTLFTTTWKRKEESLFLFIKEIYQGGHCLKF